MRCFFFKQKTAYEMRISDWSSDVCSSDLVTPSNSSCGLFYHAQADQITREASLWRRPSSDSERPSKALMLRLRRRRQLRAAACLPSTFRVSGFVSGQRTRKSWSGDDKQGSEVDRALFHPLPPLDGHVFV